jgi:Na+/H+-dicarboxylate symporter
MTSMFREASETDKEGKIVGPGPISMRRVLAFILTLASITLFVVAILFASQYGWPVFIPGGACLAAMLFLLFFTTWGDVSMLASAWKGKQ